MNQPHAVFGCAECQIGRGERVDDIVWHFSFAFSSFDIGIGCTVDDGVDGIGLEKNLTLTEIADIERFTISIDDGISSLFKCLCLTKCRTKHTVCSGDENRRIFA